MRNNKPGTTSSFVKRMLICTLILALPMFIVSLFLSARLIDEYNAGLESANSAVATFYASRADAMLDSAESFMTGIVVLMPEFQSLRTKQSTLDAHLLGLAVVDRFRANLSSESLTVAFCVISEINQLIRYAFASGYSDRMHLELMNEMDSLRADPQRLASSRWMPLSADGRDYLVRVFGQKGAWVACFADLSRLVRMGGMDGDTLNEHTLLFADREMNLLRGGESDAPSKLLLEADGSGYAEVSGQRRIVASRPIGNSGYRVLLTSPYSSVALRANVIIIPVAATLFSAVAAYAAIAYMRRRIIAPLNRFTAVIQRMHDGDFDAHIQERFAVAELQQTITVFNMLIGELSTLKISRYETEIAKKNAQMQYLMIQLRPHYIFNQFKVLYALAERNDPARLKERILDVSASLRYFFKDFRSLVPLRDELDIVRGHIAMSGEEVLTHIEVDERTMDFPIPPLLLQSFVENAIKYASGKSRPLEIFIATELIDEDAPSYLHCTLRDNGDGFSEEMLQALNAPDYSSVTKIGLANLKQRLALIYETKAVIRFSNDGGACMDALLPWQNAVDAGWASEREGDA